MIKFFYGVNSYLLRQRIRQVEAEFLNIDPNNLNYEKIDGNSLDFKRFNQAVSAMPFLADKRLVIIGNLLLNCNDLELKNLIADYIEKHKESAVDLIFVENGQPDKRTRLYKMLLKKAEVFEFLPLEGPALIKFISDSFKAEAIGISRAAADHLAQGCSGDMERISQEVIKLSLYLRSQHRENLEIADVDLLVEADTDPNVFAFTESVVKKDAKTASRLLGELLSNGENEQKLLGTIAYQFRTLIIIKDAEIKEIPQAVFTSEAKMAPFVYNKNRNLIQDKNMRTLILMYDHLRKTDAIIKSSITPADLALNILVATLCR